MQPTGCEDRRGEMSGLPIFVDPSATVVYHTVPSTRDSGGSGQAFVSGDHSQQALPPTVTMSVVQNNTQRSHDPLSNVPLPPGMEIVLGGKKYKIKYQSYEMTREKANEYIAKCSGSPFPRMSAPPDPELFHRTWGATGGNGDGALGGISATPVATDPMGVKPPAVTQAMDRRGITRRSSISTVTSEEKYQMQKTPDEVYTSITQAASGLQPPLQRGELLPQQHQLPTVPEHQLGTTENSLSQVPTYAPPPKSADQPRENLGYYWEDGVWKVWQADSGKTTASAPTGEPEAPSTIPAPIPLQQRQYSHNTFPSQLQAERPQYEYQYDFSERRQQQQQLQQSPSIVAASTTTDPASYAAPYAPPPHHSRQNPPIRSPPPPPTGLLLARRFSGSGNLSGTSGSGDPNTQRYMI